MTIRDSSRVADVVVVVPARDESARIVTCLRSLRSSLNYAVAAGAVGQVAVAVVGHNCADDTLGRAEQVLAGMPYVVVPDPTSPTVGDVRALGVRAALDLLPSRPRRAKRDRRAEQGPGSRPDGRSSRDVWILNTDADSAVPLTWVTEVLAYAKAGHQAVVGLVALTGAESGSAGALRSSAAAAAYRRIIRAGLHGRSHDHVYGANLAVRADAYAAVGEFPSVSVGEDRALVEALVRHGRPVVRPRDIVVTTSGRRDGRAVGGLATLLDTLDRTHTAARISHCAEVASYGRSTATEDAVT